MNTGTLEGVAPGDGGRAISAVDDEFARPIAGRRRLQPLVEIARREQLYRLHLVGADAFCGFAATLAATAVFGVVPTLWVLLVPFFAIVIAKLQGLYDRDDLVIAKSTAAQWPAMLQAAVMTAIGIAVGWREVTTATHGELRIFVFLVVVLFVLSIPARSLARRLARRFAPLERCVIIGDPQHHRDLAARLESLHGVELVGSLPGGQLPRSLNDLRSAVLHLGLHRVVLAPDSSTPDGDTFEMVRMAKWLGLRVSIFPTALTAVGGCAVIDDLDGLALLGVPRLGLSRSSRAIKRAFDLVGASLILLLATPLMLLIGVTIRVDSRGPALFRQRRVGRNGRRFEILKFRSMVTNAEELKQDLRELNEADGGLFKIADDPRITRLGRQIRRTHLDELPQLWNVIRGEMSLVGPRPLVEEEDALLTGEERQRLGLTPGITGPWQIRGPLSTPLPEMVKLDYRYISNWSLWEDLDILIHTGLRMFDRGGH
jgi:exopolysaccharide biosynthesis polyprenyl glycosylphosphotransferase